MPSKDRTHGKIRQNQQCGHNHSVSDRGPTRGRTRPLHGASTGCSTVSASRRFAPSGHLPGSRPPDPGAFGAGRRDDGLWPLVAVSRRSNGPPLCSSHHYLDGFAAATSLSNPNDGGGDGGANGNGNGGATSASDRSMACYRAVYRATSGHAPNGRHVARYGLGSRRSPSPVPARAWRPEVPKLTLQPCRTSTIRQL